MVDGDENSMRTVMIALLAFRRLMSCRSMGANEQNAHTCRVTFSACHMFVGTSLTYRCRRSKPSARLASCSASTRRRNATPVRIIVRSSVSGSP
jgi:hypothetical protein